MWPEWLIKVLQSMGVEGAIIFVLLTYATASTSGNILQLRHANKVYKYRLEERDKLKDALNNSSKVLEDMLRVTEDRNDLTEEQADLIKAQAAAFEMLKVTIVAQFSTIQENHKSAMDTYRVSADAVSKMADSIRVLHSIILENKAASSEQVHAIRQTITDMREDLKTQVASRNEAAISEMRRLLGQESTIVVKRRRVTDSRPQKKS